MKEESSRAGLPGSKCEEAGAVVWGVEGSSKNG